MVMPLRDSPASGLFHRLVACEVCGNKLLFDWGQFVKTPAYVCPHATAVDPIGAEAHAAVPADRVEPYLLGLIRQHVLETSLEDVARHIRSTCTVTTRGAFRAREIDAETAEALAAYMRSQFEEPDDFFELRAAITLWIQEASIEHTSETGIRIRLMLHQADFEKKVEDLDARRLD